MRRLVNTVRPCALADDDPMIVHGVSEQTPSELLLFVHGLNGHRYTTWGRFSQLFFEQSQYDIGLYGYANGFGRTAKLSATFDAQAEELAHQLRDCTYDQIAMIGHGMGGSCVWPRCET
jgi:pimeloyl-ACP methyl ester carboxylesterase